MATVAKRHCSLLLPGPPAVRINVCKPLPLPTSPLPRTKTLTWECKPTWDEQLRHDWSVAVARGHVDTYFFQNMNEQIARKAAPAAAHAAYVALHFTNDVLARLEACNFRLPASEPIPRPLLHPHVNVGVKFILGGKMRLGFPHGGEFVRNAVRYTFDGNKRLVKHLSSELRRIELDDEMVTFAACWDTAEERKFKSPWLRDDEMQAIEDRGAEPHMAVLANKLLRIARFNHRRSIEELKYFIVTHNYADLPSYLKRPEQRALFSETVRTLCNRSVCLDCLDPLLCTSYAEDDGEGDECDYCSASVCRASLVTASANGRYRMCRQCFYERGDSNVNGGGVCKGNGCNNKCAVTSDGRYAMCVRCILPVCSECTLCDTCAFFL
jgi:hypothetical protein